MAGWAWEGGRVGGFDNGLMLCVQQSVSLGVALLRTYTPNSHATS